MLIKSPLYFLFPAILAVTACATDSTITDQHDSHSQHSEKAAVCANPSSQCASTVAAEFAHNGVLWITWVNGEHVYVQSSSDKGQSFTTPVIVNAVAEKIAAKGENRPKIKLDAKGNIYVTWAWSLGEHHAGHIRFSRSSDGGKSFSAPVTVNDNLDVIGHSFESMAIGQNGEIFIAWLDARDNDAAKKAGQKFEGSSLYYTWSNDGGKSFYPNKRIAAHVCQCCRLQTAIAKDNTPVISWRHIFDGGIRDHALVKFKDWQTPDTAQRFSHENWKIDACPHHGPGLSIADSGIYHVVWFSNAPKAQGLFYNYSQDGKSFFDPVNFAKEGASHPHVLALNKQVFITWQTFDGRNNRVFVMKSENEGKAWAKPKMLAQTNKMADEPFLVSDGQNAYLSWQTAQKDYQLIAIK